jgi:acyl-CoA reductase-like NAD-dependent aldehyde dehydrogenase/nicotinamidase-related amidase
MRPALLLVDLQLDFLNAAGLEPGSAIVVARVARLLEGARAAAIPVLHAVTTVEPDGGDRMPHWKARGTWRCVRGTPGHAPPPGLAPREGEAVVSKAFFSAFSTPGHGLERALAGAGADALVIAGVHLHGCVRATALDAYARGFDVWIAEDAVGSDDPLHAAVTRRYLDGRAARFATVSELLEEWSGARRRTDAPMPPPAASASAAASAAKEAQAAWRREWARARLLRLEALADRLESESAPLARDFAIDVGKPVTQGEAEVRRAAALIRRAAALALPEPEPCGPGSASRRVPVGIVAAITPWNNPVAIPWGKIAPALALGNAVVWKPAPAATRIALRSLELAVASGLPPGVLQLLAGDHRTAALLMADPAVDAVSLSGSSGAGWAAQEICARRRIPLQAELGGNNAAIVWTGADLDAAAEAVSRGAFSFAGQRCTANRRVVVAADLFEEFLRRLEAATAALRWGDPLDPETEVGPLVSEEARDRIRAIVESASRSAERILAPHRTAPRADRPYHPPTIVVGPPHESAVVQEESFGPLLVVERAAGFEEALDLANGVRQGLVAALFAGPGPWRDRFREAAQAGILKWNASTADADAAAPFGGWKASGIGPPERGSGDLEFFSRAQALYGGL